jgi:DNA invertase Pin-like site-specific DNA recombinase
MDKKTPPVEPTGKLIGYARVSTRDQSLGMQKDALTRAGVEPDFLWEETKSGVKAKRPKLELAITQARRGDTIVVYKLDRFGRSLLDLIEKVQDLTKRGIGFRSLTEGFDTTTPGGRLLFHVIGALAQFERDLVVERTRDGMAAARERGSQIGAVKKFTEDMEKEAAAMMLAGMRPLEVARHFSVTRATLYNRPQLKKIMKRLKAKRKAARLKKRQ